jgi:hypothetical protein
VTFTGTIAPDSLGGMQVPRAMRWFWRDSVSLGWDLCHGSSTCVYTPPRTGRMWWSGTVNGEPDSLSASIQVIPCPTNDSLLDRPDFRKLFKQIYDSSGPTLPFLDRREHGGFLYIDQDADSLIYKPFPVTGSNSSPCSLQVMDYPAEPPPTWLVAIPHAHPSDSGTVVPPGVCRQAMAGGITGPGASPQDDALAESQMLPVYAVDSKYIYRTLGPGQHSKWPRVSACTIF